MKRRYPCPHTPAPLAYSRIDLLAVIGAVLLLGLWLLAGQAGERGRISRCAANLSVLGKAMHSYANDHAGALPAAAIELGKVQVSWDTKLLPVLKPGLARTKNERLFEGVPRAFRCPSDAAPHHGVPRSYAMGANDMAPQHWPPGSQSATGVGLVWNNETVQALLEANAPPSPESLPVLKLANVPVPAETLLLAELIGDANNILGGVLQAAVADTAHQRQFLPDGGGSFHYGKLNYLMVDGHVERLSALQTGSFDGSGGIWTLRKRY